MNYLSYPWAILFGLYFYLLFQAMYLWRFGTVNTLVGALDIFIVLVGILSVVLLMYFARKLERGRGWLLVPFLIALPFAYVGALGGGLLGYMGVVIFGLIPFIIALPIGYWVIKRFVSGGSVPPPSSPGL